MSHDCLAKISVISDLSGSRVLDLTDEKGQYACRLLADLGAEVIKIEPPGGDRRRSIRVFNELKQKQEVIDSIDWYNDNLGKKSITLNIESSEGKKLFVTLAKGADFLFESFAPGYMGNLGLSYDNLQTQNKGIIYVSISPFGQTGPYKDYKSSDIVAMAMGGHMFLTGYPDRAPLRVSLDMANRLASLQATLGALMAFHYKQRTTLGQYVDVSIQEAIACILINAIPMWELNKTIVRRTGQFWFRTNETSTRIIWPCKDGAVAFQILGGRAGARSNKALSEWMSKIGIASKLNSVEWEAFDLAITDQELLKSLEEPISRFFMLFTKKDLQKQASERGISIQPVQNVQDILACEQLAARGYWLNEESAVGHKMLYPRPFFHRTADEKEAYFQNPSAGQYNQQVYQKELGLSSSQIEEFRNLGII